MYIIIIVASILTSIAQVISPNSALGHMARVHLNPIVNSHSKNACREHTILVRDLLVLKYGYKVSVKPS